MAVTVEELKQGFRAHSIHGRPMRDVDVPGWTDEVGTAIELVAGADPILYAQALWIGTTDKAEVLVRAFTEHVMVVSRVPDSRGSTHRTTVVARRSLQRLELETFEGLANWHVPGVRVWLWFEASDQEVLIPEPAHGAYVSTTDISPLIAGFARDL